MADRSPSLDDLSLAFAAADAEAQRAWQMKSPDYPALAKARDEVARACLAARRAQLPTLASHRWMSDDELRLEFDGYAGHCIVTVRELWQHAVDLRRFGPDYDVACNVTRGPAADWVRMNEDEVIALYEARNQRVVCA